MLIQFVFLIQFTAYSQTDTTLNKSPFKIADKKQVSDADVDNKKESHLSQVYQLFALIL
jgi:hypothetical protein